MTGQRRGDRASMVAAAALGKPLAEIAAAAGTSISTVQRRLREPAVIAEIKESRSHFRVEALGRLVELRASAFGRLQELLADQDPRVALRATALVLNTSSRFEELVDLDDRITNLEQESGIDRERTAQSDAARGGAS